MLLLPAGSVPSPYSLPPSVGHSEMMALKFYLSGFPPLGRGWCKPFLTLNLKIKNKKPGKELWLVVVSQSTQSSSSSPNFLAPETGFMEDNFPAELGSRGWFRDDSSVLHLLCTLFLLLFHQLHLRSSGIRSWGWGPLIYGISPGVTYSSSQGNPMAGIRKELFSG